MSGKFGRKVKYFPVADFLADMKSNAPSYDEKTRTITVVNDIVEQGQVMKKHLLVMKFYDKGLATFYFYSPPDLFDDAEQLFNQVLESFHSGDIESVLPKEEVKVREIEPGGESPGLGLSTGLVIVVVLLLVAVIVIVAVITRRKK
jgi:hypothetical protein